MKCCVPKCNNRGKNVKKLGNLITFHLFPRDYREREAWIAALEMLDTSEKVTETSTICSEHFRSQDLIMKGDTQTVVTGALPRRLKSAETKTCRVCLSLDSKMYKMSETYSLPCQNKGFNLDYMYEFVTGIAINHKDVKMPNQVCWECAARLYSCATFKSKALLSDKLLKDVLEENEYIKEDHIITLQTQHSTLKSTLVKTESMFDELPFINPLDYIQPVICHEPVATIRAYNEPAILPNETNSVLIENPLEVDEIKTENTIENDNVMNVDEVPIVVINNHINGEVKTEIDLVTNDFENENAFEDFMIDTKEFESNDFVDTSDNEVVNDYVKDQIPVVQLNEVNTDKVLFNDFVEIQTEVKKEKLKKERVKKKVAKKKIKSNENFVIHFELPREKRGRNFARPKMAVDENVFTIRPMTVEEQIKEIEDRKESEKYKMSPYKCVVCYMGFPTEDKLKRHSYKHSEACGAFKCKICKVRFKKTYKLRSHMTRHREEYICKLCPFVTRARCVAIPHMQFHAGKKFTCPQCPTEFEKRTTLLNHLRLKHISSCVCELCGYTFVSEMGVKSHKRMRHCTITNSTINLEGPHCDVCDVKFLNQKAYDRHLRLSSKHIESENDPNRLSNDPSIKCRRIGNMNKRAERRPDIRRRDPNRKLNRKQDPVECEQCGVVLQNHHAYALHFRAEHPGINRTQYPNVTPYMCDQCGKIFLNTTALENHQWVHTGEKRYECDHCHETFSVKANLANHMQVHEEVRNSYPCRICGKVFAFSFNRNRHMFLHTGIKPHKCDSCEKAFANRTDLRSHIDYVHLKKPRPKRVRRKAKKTSGFEYTGMEY